MATQKGGRHWALGFVFLLTLLATSAIVAADTVELTPTHPTRVDMLTCTYTVPEPGVFRFEFYKNQDADPMFMRETDKRTVAFRPQGLVNGNRILCVVSKRDFRGEFNGLGSDTVTVGAFQCNDLNDNDGDTRIDMQDPGCRMPKDNSEAEPACSDGQDNDRDGLIDLADPGCMLDTQKNEETFADGPECDNGIDDDGDGTVDMRSPGCDEPTDDRERVDYAEFCRRNPRNLYCRGLGMNDLVLLCNAAQQPVCREQNVAQAEGFCRQKPREDICVGVQNLAARCDGRREDLLCNEVQAQMISCRDDRECLEITNADEEILCRLHAYQFCPRQEAAEQPAADAAGQEQPAPVQPQPQQPQPPAGAEDERREEVREAIEETYRDIRERQQRLEEERRRAAAAVPPLPAAPSPVYSPRPPTQDSKQDSIAQKERVPLPFGKKATGLPTAGVIAAAAGIIALVGGIAYLLTRSRRPSTPAPPRPPTPPPTQPSFVVKTMKIRRQRAQDTRHARKRKK